MQDQEPLQPETTSQRKAPRELAMSAAWHGGLARSLVTVDGRGMRVVFHGNWSHGFGPDFENAMIEIDGAALTTGAVEIHTRASDWLHHGHHLDPRYNDVVLHVVSKLDTAETRTASGKIVPTVVLDVPTETLFAIDNRLPEIWTTLGGEVCAPELSAKRPDLVREVFWRLGDQRLDLKTKRFEGELIDQSPSDVLVAALFDVFGYSENRIGMVGVAERWVRHQPKPHREGLVWTTAWLLGVAGYLPLSPGDASFTGLDQTQRIHVEALWAEIGSGLGESPLSPNVWTRTRVRPANHPAARLMSVAALLYATQHHPLPMMLSLVRDGGDPVERLRVLTLSPYGPGLGKSRVIAMLANAVIPFALAFARHTEDDELEDAAARAWASLPVSEWSRPAKRALRQATGLDSITKLGERGNQGLLHLDRMLCTPRRCFECPIAAEVMREQTRQ